MIQIWMKKTAVESADTPDQGAIAKKLSERREREKPILDEGIPMNYSKGFWFTHLSAF